MASQVLLSLHHCDTSAKNDFFLEYVQTEDSQFVCGDGGYHTYFMVYAVEEKPDRIGSSRFSALLFIRHYNPSKR
jgi:hypothetical protein